MADRACTNCKRIVESGSECDICKNDELTSNWRGLVVIYDPEDSEIAEELGVTTTGKYAVQVNV
ncbi:MAG: transcription elongation factor subunit Spt4 [Candidatus Nanohaloarchaea archaeon]|nr:transcription elongation factor subunit Spt4 [Candidatus Nanohaloarchaea archaeon]